MYATSERPKSRAVSDEDTAPPEWAAFAPPSAGSAYAAASRTPPHSAEAEQSVLGALLLDAGCYCDVADALSPADFFSHEHGAIFAAIGAVVASGGAVDMISVYEHLRATYKASDCGGLPYLNSLAQSVPSARHALRYAEIVANHAMMRAVIAAGDALVSRAFAAQDPGAVLEEAQSALSSLDMRRKGPRRGVPLLKLAELREQAQAVRWLCKHVVPADSVGMLFGASGTFKSFLALDLALHVAHGLPWLGRKTQRGQVVYVAAEGGAGLWSRIHAWHAARRMRWEDAWMVVVPVAVDLGNDAWRVVEAAQRMGVTPALVVVDTLSQTYSGEENSAGEMAAYLREIGVRFRALWHCATMLVHHSGHQATERPRGSSALRANIDWMLGCFRDEKELIATLTCEKQKDGELFEDASFSLSRVELGRDEDGDALSSLVARHLSSAEEVDQAEAAEASAGRGGRNRRLIAMIPPQGIEEKALRKSWNEQCADDGMSADATKRAFFRARQQALRGGRIDVSAGFVRLVCAPQHDEQPF